MIAWYRSGRHARVLRLDRRHLASVWVRESNSVLAFPAILSAHAIGMGLTAGFNAALGLSLLGAVASMPVAPWVEDG